MRNHVKEIEQNAGGITIIREIPKFVNGAWVDNEIKRSFVPTMMKATSEDLAKVAAKVFDLTW